MLCSSPRWFAVGLLSAGLTLALSGAVCLRALNGLAAEARDPGAWPAAATAGLLVAALVGIVALVQCALLWARLARRERAAAALQNTNDELSAAAGKADALARDNELLTAEVVERRRAERQLREQAVRAIKEQELRYHQLVKVCPDAILVHQDGKIVFANDACVQLLRAGSRDRLLGKPVLDIAHPDYHKIIHKRFEALRGSGHAVPLIEEKLVRLDGTLVEVEVAAAAFLDNGRETIQAVARDISARKKADTVNFALLERLQIQNRELSRSEAKYRALIETTDTGYVIVDPEGRVLDANDEFVRLTGHASLEQISGRRVTEWTAPYDLERNAAEVRKCAETGVTAHLEIDYCDGDGNITPIEINGRVIESAEGTRIVALCRDISERREAERKLRESREQLRRQWAELELIYRTAPIGMCLVDRELRYQRINECLAAINGRPSADHIGRPLADMIPEVAGQVVPVYEQVIRTGEAVTDVEAHGTAAGGERDWLCSYHPHRDPSGEILGVSCFVVDITERKNAERALRESHTRLAQVTRQLITAQETERRHLARELHDEIGQVLTAISIHLQAVRAHCSAAALPSLEECSAVVAEAVRQVRDMSLDMRPPMLDDFGLAVALRWYLGRQEQRLGIPTHFSAHTLGQRLPAELEAACYRVVQEAVTNVLRHARAGNVWVDLRQDEGGVELSVRDDGVGFDVPAARDRARHGASVGLLGMQERVELLGGRFAIESSPGGGTTVRLALAAESPEGTAP